MSRDPIGERGGVNLFTMCINNTIRYVDIFGALPTVFPMIVLPDVEIYHDTDDSENQLPDRHHRRANRIVRVGRCEIHVLWGHHFRRRRIIGPSGLETVRLVTYEDEKYKECSAAAIITCFAERIPNHIPLPGYTPIGKDVPLPYVTGPGARNHPGPNQLTEGIKVRNAARSHAETICNIDSCCCENVVVTVSAMYGVRWWESQLPPLSGFTVPCQK